MAAGVLARSLSFCLASLHGTYFVVFDSSVFPSRFSDILPALPNTYPAIAARIVAISWPPSIFKTPNTTKEKIITITVLNSRRNENPPPNREMSMDSGIFFSARFNASASHFFFHLRIELSLPFPIVKIICSSLRSLFCVFLFLVLASSFPVLSIPFFWLVLSPIYPSPLRL